MLTKVILKPYDSPVDRRDSSIVGVFIPKKRGTIRGVVTVVTLLENYIIEAKRAQCALILQGLKYYDGSHIICFSGL